MKSNKLHYIHPCWFTAPLLVCLTALPAAASPPIVYERSETRITQDAEVTDWYGPVQVYYTNTGGQLLSGTHWPDLMALEYHESFPPVLNVSDVVGVSAGSQGWSDATPQSQAPYCEAYDFTDSSAWLGNTIHVVDDYDYPVPVFHARCAYKITGVPVEGIIRDAGKYGVFGVGQDGSILRKRFVSGQITTTDVIPSWGGRPLVGSLVLDGKNVAGVNEFGKMFTTWDNNGSISYAVIQQTANVAPASLVMSNGNGVFGVTTSGGLFRTYWSGGWQVQSIPTWSGKIVPGSLIAGDGTGVNADVYGVNEHGKIVSTWRNNGVVTYNIIAQTANVAANSLALSNGNGVFGVTTSGGLMRTYWSGGWQAQPIPTWSGKIVPGSLITGDGSGANGNVYGVNEHGKVVGTWLDDGVVTYTIINQTANVAPNSLVLSAGLGVFGVTTSGGLFRIFYGGPNGPGWHVQNIATSGGEIVPESLIAGPGVGSAATVYGVNEFGKLVKTSALSGGVIPYSVMP